MFFLFNFFKYFNFLIYYSVLQTFQKDYCSIIPTYHGNLKKSFHLKHTTKNFIKTMDISSLLNTDLGNLNGSSFIM